MGFSNRARPCSVRAVREGVEMKRLLVVLAPAMVVVVVVGWAGPSATAAPDWADPSFGPHGTFLVDETLQSWRNLYLSTRVARFLDDGKFDQAFGGHGRTHLGRSRFFPLIALDGEARIVLAGAAGSVSRAGHGASVTL